MFKLPIPSKYGGEDGTIWNIKVVNTATGDQIKGSPFFLNIVYEEPFDKTTAALVTGVAMVVVLVLMRWRMKKHEQKLEQDKNARGKVLRTELDERLKRVHRWDSYPRVVVQSWNPCRRASTPAARWCSTTQRRGPSSCSAPATNAASTSSS